MSKRPDTLAIGNRTEASDMDLVHKLRNRVTSIAASSMAGGGAYGLGGADGQANEDKTASTPSQDHCEKADLVGRCAKSHARRCAINSVASTTAIMVIVVLVGASIDAPIVDCSSLQQDTLMGRTGRVSLMTSFIPQRQQQYPSSVARRSNHLQAAIAGDGLEKLFGDGLFGDSDRTSGRVRRHIGLDTRSAAGHVNFDKAAKAAPMDSSSDTASAMYPVSKVEPADSTFSLQQDDPNELYLARERILDSLRDQSRKYVLATVRDPVILIHKLQALIQDIAWSMLEELKR